MVYLHNSLIPAPTISALGLISPQQTSPACRRKVLSPKGGKRPPPLDSPCPPDILTASLRTVSQRACRCDHAYAVPLPLTGYNVATDAWAQP
jgi:hypothetical protein